MLNKQEELGLWQICALSWWVIAEFWLHSHVGAK